MHSIKCDGTLFCCFLILVSTMRTWNLFWFYSSFTFHVSFFAEVLSVTTLHSFSNVWHTLFKWMGKEKPINFMTRKAMKKREKSYNVIKQRSTSIPFATFKWGFSFDVFLFILSSHVLAFSFWIFSSSIYTYYDMQVPPFKWIHLHLVSV